MSLQSLSLRYGNTVQEASINAANLIGILQPEELASIPNISTAVAAAVNRPVDGSLPLGKRVKPGQRVTILVSDVTRAWVRTAAFLPPLIAELNAVGIADSDITLLVANGTHRSHKPHELALVCGPELVQRLTVVEHDCRDTANLVDLGVTSQGTPVQINKLAIETDFLLLTGGIVIHLMSGFGGGRKSVCPGVAGYRTVQANHCLLLDSSAEVQIASAKTSGNAMHEDMMEIARMVSPDFLLNVIVNGKGDLAEIVAGNWDTAWELGCAKVMSAYSRPLSRQAQLSIASCGGFPNDINLYQATKALTNAALATEPGGVIILVAACPEGAGAAEFADWLRYSTLAEFTDALRLGFTVPGYVAFMQAKIARSHRVFLVSRLDDNLVRRTGALPFHDLQSAVDAAYRVLGGAPATVLLPQGATTKPHLAAEQVSEQ